jgi:diguanylate cyclase
VVNDLLGHAPGDAVLVAVANRLRAAVRSVNVVARLGTRTRHRSESCFRQECCNSAWVTQRLLRSSTHPHDRTHQRAAALIEVLLSDHPGDGQDKSRTKQVDEEQNAS